MMTIKQTLTALLLGSVTATAFGAVSEEEAQRLGQDLTPIGAERAGNEAGTIPAWDGGLTEVHPDFEKGGHYPDPYADDERLFTITGKNYEKYEENLSAGQIALLKRYPTWKMHVYPTRRSAAYPEGIYEETKTNATKVELVEGGNGFEGTTGGVPFPIPQSGLEAIWNHLTHYRGDTYATTWEQAAVTQGGDYTLVDFDYEYDFVYSNQDKSPSEREDNLLFYFLQVIREPPRLAGSALLVYEYANQVKQPRRAWTYNPGQRRVRLAPNVAYDNPGTAADALRTNDDFGMYNGATDRYEWTLHRKKEMYIPYNSYEANGPTLSVEEMVRPNHVNPEPLRYELHRVWVVEANLKEGTSHIYKRRMFYLDEDSWGIAVTDKYDNRDQLWRVDEDHKYAYYDIPFLAPGMEVKHDLQSGRYIALSLRNDKETVYKPIERTPADFSPAGLRDLGLR